MYDIVNHNNINKREYTSSHHGGIDIHYNMTLNIFSYFLLNDSIVGVYCFGCVNKFKNKYIFEFMFESNYLFL